MVSSSKTASNSKTVTEDNKIAADGEAQILQSEGGDIHIVPDEAFELGRFAIATVADSLGGALEATQSNSRTEGAQLGETLIKIGIPAAALIFILTRAK